MSTQSRTHGRTSCWVLGGVGCLGLLIVGIIGIWLLANQVGKTFGGLMEPFMVLQQEVAPHMKKIADAIQGYQKDIGKYPPTLNALVPKYLPSQAVQVITLKDGTQLQWVYTPPKPTDAEDTIILEHKPPLKGGFAGSQVDVTLQVQKNFKMFIQQVITSPDGKRQFQRTQLD
ncbi:MAG: hypothetical protein C4337_04050 [Armatimonadota bacterium]